MSWFLRNWDQVAIALWEHVTISLTALSIAFVLSLAIGIVAARNARFYAAALPVAGFLYTIPSLACLVLLIPNVRLRPTNTHLAMIARSRLLLIRKLLIVT